MEPSDQVYVLQNPAGRHYLGLSENVNTRLAQHNDGQSKWTATRPASALVLPFLIDNFA